MMMVMMINDDDGDFNHYDGTDDDVEIDGNDYDIVQ